MISLTKLGRENQKAEMFSKQKATTWNLPFLLLLFKEKKYPCKLQKKIT